YFNKSFVPKSISNSDSLSYILKENQGKSFKISDENTEFLKEEIYNTFGKVIDSNTRSLFARVADAKNVVLIEEGTYAYVDFTDVNPSFLSELKIRSEEHTSELQSRFDLVCRLLLEKKKRQRTDS